MIAPLTFLDTSMPGIPNIMHKQTLSIPPPARSCFKTEQTKNEIYKKTLQLKIILKIFLQITQMISTKIPLL